MIKMTPTEHVEALVHSFYHEHHDLGRFKTELAAAVGPKIEGFTECKRRVVEAFDYRLDRMNESLAVLRKNPEKVRSVIDDMESRVDELESFRSYVKGMVTRVK